MVDVETRADSSHDRRWFGRTVGGPPEDATGVGPTVRELGDSGLLSGLSEALTLDRRVRSLRRGGTGRGLLRLVVGGLFVAVAVVQRRSRDRRESRGVAPAPWPAAGRSDLEDVSSGLDRDGRSSGLDPDRRRPTVVRRGRRGTLRFARLVAAFADGRRTPGWTVRPAISGVSLDPPSSGGHGDGTRYPWASPLDPGAPTPSTDALGFWTLADT